MSKTCLVVDDEVSIRRYLKLILQNAQFQVVEAGDADQALQVLQQSSSIDLIISDVLMPGSMNGLDLAYSIRRRSPELPIIIISGYVNLEDNPWMGSFSFVQKPFTAASIMAEVHRLLESRAAHAPNSDAAWASRFRCARIALRLASARMAEALDEHPDGLAGSPDGAFAIRKALREETAALKEFKKVLGDRPRQNPQKRRTPPGNPKPN